MKEPRKSEYTPSWKFKLDLKIKVSLLILTTITFALQANTGFSQKTKVSLDMDDVTLSRVLDEIESNTDFKFIFNTKDVDLKRKVSISVKNKKIQKVLDRLFDGFDTSYEVYNTKILLKKPSGEALNKEDALPNLAAVASRQGFVVSGTVTDEEGVPLPGANIVEKGTTNGTQTDFDGNFSIEVEDGAILVVSYIGFAPKEVSVDGQSTVSVSLAEDAAGLEEVVVVGYGTQKKSDIVGSVASISSERLEQNANPNVFQAMQAAAPGLSIQRGSGEPGTSGNIQIRGLNSISASNQPLIIFDGIPFAGNIRDINPNDIASIEVLKDASAAAIYGSRAANGVILITTKKGTDKMVVEFNTSWSLQNEAVEYELMNPQQFYDTRREAFRSEGLLEDVAEVDVPARILEENELKSWERGETVDWMDEMINENALRQDYQVSIRTGNENIKEYFSLSYLDEEGLEQSTGFNRITLQNNLEFTSLTDWLKIGDNFSLSINDLERRVGGNAGSRAYYRLSPYSRIFEDDGSYTIFPQANDNLHRNPIAENQLTTRENKFNNLFNNIYFEVTPGFVEGLSYTMRLGSTFRNASSAIYYPAGTFLGDALNGSAEVENSKTLDLTWENILQYDRTFGRHNLGLTGLFSRQHHTFESRGASSSGFVSDDYLWNNLSGGAVVGTPTSLLNEWDLVSYMFRAVYNFDERYYLTATGRRDGYSGFGEGNKYGIFPSIALAWRISEENFMTDVSWLDDFKVRASYGSVGNQAVGTYNSLAQLTNAQPIFGEELTAGIRVSALANPDLSWETTNTFNVAADFSTLKGRLSGTVEYYNSETNDILLSREIPKLTGQDDITFNIGKVKNTGVEVALNTIPVSSNDFSWRVDLNFSRNRNEILELFGDDQDDITNEWFIGEPIQVYYDFEFGGIWQSGQENEIAESATPDRRPGDAQLIDQNNDGVLDGDDRKIVGYQQPDWSGGISNTFSYKGLSLNVFVQTVQGRDRRLDIVNNNRFGRVNDPPFDFWTPENPSNTWVRPGIESGLFYGSMDIYDASFVRIKDITLSYNLPTSLLEPYGLQGVRAYVNLHDYFTFTDFPYIDPESASLYEISIPKYVQWGLNITF